MTFCPRCGTTLDAGSRFCPKDGTTVRPESELLDDTIAVPPGDADASAAAVAPVAVPRTSVPTEAHRLFNVTIDGRYRIGARLGEGGVGAIYRGEHVETRRPVAIKMLHAIYSATTEFHKRFEREARAASRLNHPSCVSVLDFGRIDRVEPIGAAAELLGVPYLVMEFVEGQTLAARLAASRGQPLPPSVAVLIASGVLLALRQAHQLSIVHRDVKPANIMLVDERSDSHGPFVKLLDFGLAKITDEGEGGERLTQIGTVFGTPGYLSPEQAEGKAADHRSDLYALGIILYEMVVGRRPFVRPDPLDVVRDHVQTPPPPPRSLGAKISPALEAVILRTLTKRPDDRFQNATELLRAIAATPEGSQVASTRSRPLSPLVSGRVLPEWAWAASVGGLLVAAMLLAWGIGRASHRPSTKGEEEALRPPARAPIVSQLPRAEAPPAAPPLSMARRHVTQAVSYRRRLWCSNALEELEQALAEDPALRDDAELQRTAIGCLTPKTRDKAVRFLVNRVGPAAREALSDTAIAASSAALRQGAQVALAQLPK